MFISKAFGGRCSDKAITENCGILDLLQDGDMILADKGFNIGSSLDERNVSIKMPVFKKNGNQIDAVDVESSQRLSSLRIIVERVIGSLRQKYMFLHSGVLPISVCSKFHNGVPLLTQILNVTAALVNLNPEIINF